MSALSMGGRQPAGTGAARPDSADPMCRPGTVVEWGRVIVEMGASCHATPPRSGLLLQKPRIQKARIADTREWTWRLSIHRGQCLRFGEPTVLPGQHLLIHARCRDGVVLTHPLESRGGQGYIPRHLTRRK